VTLNDVTVTDPLCTLVPSGTGPLAPAERRDYSCEYTVIQTDLDAGALVNRANAVATPAGCGLAAADVAATQVARAPANAEPCAPLAKDAAVTVEMMQSPGVSLVKSVTTAQVVAGADLTFTVEVVNTGNVTLLDVQVTDPMCALQMTGTDSGGDGNLGVGERWEFVCTYRTTATDAAVGQVINVATVESTTLAGVSVRAQGSATATVTPAPPVQPIPVAAPNTLPVTGATMVGLIGLGAGLLLTGLLLTGRVARSNQNRGRTSL